ncbi:ras-related and estrogen-regulated growth inhibitor-like protein [Latimeria chalumnae]|uniref:ras-related and estrogen-regulated growth inhibitor-like protein n=1 Tax=Latimeria chalumnae TaxID=7897 RepID=UPI00313D02EF
MNDLKLTVLGTEGAGKSALVVRFLTRRFIGEYASNSDCIYRKRLSLDGRQMNVEIYDPCSQVCDGKSFLSDQVHWADGFIVVYDISDRSSFVLAKALVRGIQEVQLGASKRDTESMVFLVGNKQDLCHMREVSREEGQKLAMEHKCQFYELSAAEHYQEVVAMFSKVIRSISGSSKFKEKRRPSGSKSMAKLINNVFGKRRKSV